MVEERKTSFPKGRMKVLLLENIDPLAKQAFETAGYPVEQLRTSLGEDALAEKLQDVFVLGIRSNTQVTPKVLENARKLTAVGAFCIGTEQINLPAASEAGVAVFNDPFSNTRSVVELVLGEMIMLSRGTFDKSRGMHDGIWDKSAEGSAELRGKTLGIIGYGNIGKQLSVVAETFGMRVIFYNTSETVALGNARRMYSMNQVLEASDIVSVHVSGKVSNEGLIGEKEFMNMKDGALFINASRGKVVDLEALARQIRSEKIRGAAIDVYPSEPKSNGPGFESPLRGLPNVILTPHIGGSTGEAQRLIAEAVSGRLISFLDTGDTGLSVNWPRIQLPSQKSDHRFLHYHRNVPGVLANLNGVLGSRGINVTQQYLQTNADFGYAVVDVNKNYDDRVLIGELKAVPGTIRFRPLY